MYKSLARYWKQMVNVLFSISQKAIDTFTTARKTFFVRSTCLFAWMVCLLVSCLGLFIDTEPQINFIIYQIIIYAIGNTILLGIVYFLPKQKFPFYYIIHTIFTLGIYCHTALLGETYAQFYTPIAMLELFLGAALLPAFPKVAFVCSAIYWLGVTYIRYWVLPPEYDLSMFWLLANAIGFVSIGSAILYYGLFFNLTNVVRTLRLHIYDLDELTSLLNITMNESQFGLIGFDNTEQKRFERGAPIDRLHHRTGKGWAYDSLPQFRQMIEQDLHIEFRPLFDTMQEVVIGEKHFILRAYRLEDTIVISHMDVTDLRAVEDKLRQNQKLSVIGEITSGVAHNYNNALAIALSRLEAINPNENKAFWDEHIGPSIRAIQTSSEVSRKLLAFSGQQALKVESFDASEAIRSMSGLIESALGGGINYQIMAQAPLFIYTDKSEFESAVLNLLLNAKNAISHEFGKVSISAASYGDFVQICVEDNGSGIPDAIIEKVFDPFFSTHSKKSSTGLGLATVKGFVEQSKGFVSVETEPGKTRFLLFFPLHTPQCDAAISEPEQHGSEHRVPARMPVEVSVEVPVSAAQENILIVDDKLEVARSYAKLLKAMGYTARYETSPLAALTSIRQDADLTKVIIDFSMPEMNGIILAKKVKEHRPDLMLFMLTGDVGSYWRDGFSVNFFEEVLIKPINAQELRQVIEKHPVGFEDVPFDHA